MFTQTIAAGLAALEATPPDLFAKARAVTATIIDRLTSDPRKARSYREAFAHDTLHEHARRAAQTVAGLYVDQIVELYRVDSVDVITELQAAALVLVAGMAEVVGYWLDGSVSLSVDRLVTLCARMAVATADEVAGSR
jgi:hypothetical protein